MMLLNKILFTVEVFVSGIALAALMAGYLLIDWFSARILKR